MLRPAWTSTPPLKTTLVRLLSAVFEQSLTGKMCRVGSGTLGGFRRTGIDVDQHAAGGASSKIVFEPSLAFVLEMQPTRCPLHDV
jgi:hypothetical protein